MKAPQEERRSYSIPLKIRKKKRNKLISRRSLWAVIALIALASSLPFIIYESARSGLARSRAKLEQIERMAPEEYRHESITDLKTKITGYEKILQKINW